MVDQSHIRPFDREGSLKRCYELRRRILEMSQSVPALHIGGAFSCLEMVELIYSYFLRFDHRKMIDTFILSKGHGCLAQYTNLERLGYLSRRDLELFCKPDGRIATHPDFGVPGIEASTGSLGHGLGMAIGMAYADRILNQDRNIYVVLSDGELQEGSVWENILLVPALKLKRIVAFVDSNDFQSLDRMSKSHPNFYPIPEKLRSFGWECVEVNGHDAGAICDAVCSRKGEAPFFVVARTVKGRGIKYMENVPIWHYRSPNPEEFQKAMEELTEVRA